MIVGRGKGAPIPVERPRSGSDVNGLHRKVNMEVSYIGQHCDGVPRYVMALGPGTLCQCGAVEIPRRHTSLVLLQPLGKPTTGLADIRG